MRVGGCEQEVSKLEAQKIGVPLSEARVQRDNIHRNTGLNPDYDILCFLNIISWMLASLNLKERRMWGSKWELFHVLPPLLRLVETRTVNSQYPSRKGC